MATPTGAKKLHSDVKLYPASKSSTPAVAGALGLGCGPKKNLHLVVAYAVKRPYRWGMKLQSTLREAIRARYLAGYLGTQDAMAKASGVHQPRISAFLSGARGLREDRLLKLAAVAGFEVQVVLLANKGDAGQSTKGTTDDGTNVAVVTEGTT